MRRLFIALTAAVAVLTATPALAAPAVSVDLFWTTLVSRGVAADISFATTCPEGSVGTVDVAVTQLRDDGLTASGSETAVLTCGFPDIQRVLADIGGAPFERGPATLTMLISGCDGDECFTKPINRTIRLKP